MRAFLFSVGLALLGSLIVSSARAQDLVVAADVPAVVQTFTATPSKSSLPCEIDLANKTRLDFMFRYTAGFVVECRLGKIPPDTPLFAFVRVTPQGGQPVLMVEKFNAPKMRSEEFTRLYSAPLNKMTARMTGGFATGPGEYLLEVVLTDQHGHSCRKSRKLRVGGDEVVQVSSLALGRGVVMPLLRNRWNGMLTDDGLRLTVLLHAYSPRDNAGHSALERSYMLQSLDALLGQLPCRSVKLIAFSLDHQQEVFHSNSFDGKEFPQLEKALQQTQFGAIHYQALKEGAWAKFLVDMTQTEASSEPPPDAIVFLGAWGSHEYDTLPADTPKKFVGSNAHIYYLEYFPPANLAHGKDGLERLINHLHGSIFVVWTPEMLAQAIKKMTAEMHTMAMH